MQRLHRFLRYSFFSSFRASTGDNGSLIPIFAVIAATALFLTSALAAEKYDRNKICADSNVVECDLLVEKAVSESVPGVVDRAGRTLKVRARNGKTIERKNADTKIQGEGSSSIWVCDYLPAYGYVRLCYRLWEKAQTEYINLETGDSVLIKGFPQYSPSGQQVLFINHHVNSVYGIEIWRFEKNRIVKEFEHTPSAEFFAETGKWENENEIKLASQFSINVVRYRIVKRGGTWVLQNL